MRFWKSAAVRVSTAPLHLHVDEARLASDALAAGMRARLAFDVLTARMARDAATPALGKATPQTWRSQY